MNARDAGAHIRSNRCGGFWESKPEHDTQHRADDQANQAGGRKYLQTARWGVRACALMGPIRRNGRLGLAAAA